MNQVTIFIIVDPIIRDVTQRLTENNSHFQCLLYSALSGNFDMKMSCVAQLYGGILTGTVTAP